MNTNGPLFTPFLLSIMAAPWPQLLSAPLRLPWNIHYTMNHVETAERAAPVYPAPRSQLPKSPFTLILRWAFGLHAVLTRLFFCCTILAMIFHLIWAYDIFFFWTRVLTRWKEKERCENVSALMFCARAAHFVVPKELIIWYVSCTTSKKVMRSFFASV